MMRPYTQREYELLTHFLDRSIDVEKSAGNAITAALLVELKIFIERKPLRGVA